MNAKQIHQRHTSVEWLVLWKAKVSLWTMERHKYTLSWNNNYCADCGNDKMQLPVIIRACTRYIYMQTATRWCWSNIRGTQSSSNKNLILHLILLSLTHTHTHTRSEVSKPIPSCFNLICMYGKVVRRLNDWMWTLEWHLLSAIVA